MLKYCSKSTYHVHLFTMAFALCKQESTHKLSDQQLAVNQGQNPLPIYLALNVKDDFSTLDFKGIVYHITLWRVSFQGWLNAKTFYCKAKPINLLKNCFSPVFISGFWFGWKTCILILCEGDACGVDTAWWGGGDAFCWQPWEPLLLLFSFWSTPTPHSPFPGSSAEAALVQRAVKSGEECKEGRRKE